MDALELVSGPDSLKTLLARAGPAKSRIFLLFEGERIPAFVFRGKNRGPSVWIQAGQHGDEYDGIAACLRLEGELSRIRAGTVVLLPIANHTAFLAGRNASPKDRVNLNRVFKNGSEAGYSRRLGTWFAELISSCADALLDLHGGGKYLDVCNFVMVPDDRSLELVPSGCRFICHVPKGGGMLIDELSRRGLRAILHESGGGIGSGEDCVSAHINFVSAVLEGLSMMPKSELASAGTANAVHIRSLTDVHFAGESGILLWHLPCGSAVRRGDLLMSGVSAADFSRWEMRCPVQCGHILSLHTASLVKPGTYAAMIGMER
jgi:predicted deacylase